MHTRTPERNIFPMHVYVNVAVTTGLRISNLILKFRKLFSPDTI